MLSWTSEPQIPFDLVLGTDHLTDSGSLVIGPVLYLDIAIDPSLIEDLGSAATTDPEDVSQGNFSSFVCGKSTPTILIAILILVR